MLTESFRASFSETLRRRPAPGSALCRSVLNIVSDWRSTVVRGFSTLPRGVLSCLVVLSPLLMENGVLSAATPPDESQYSLALERTFPTVTLDEKDLGRLTEIVSELPRHYGGHIDIEVTSADGQETVKTTTSHAFFLTSGMPRLICCINISYYNLAPLVSFHLTIGSQFSNAVNLSAEGADSAVVSGVFREVERELESHALHPELLYSQFSWPGFAFFFMSFMLLGALSMISFFALLTFLRRIGLHHLDLQLPSSKGEGLGLVGTLLILSFVVGAFALTGFLRNCFPSTEFTGQLSDPGTYNRSWLVWIGSFIILPIILTEVQRRWDKRKA